MRRHVRTCGERIDRSLILTSLVQLPETGIRTVARLGPIAVLIVSIACGYKPNFPHGRSLHEKQYSPHRGTIAEAIDRESESSNWQGHLPAFTKPATSAPYQCPIARGPW